VRSDELQTCYTALVSKSNNKQLSAARALLAFNYGKFSVRSRFDSIGR